MYYIYHIPSVKIGCSKDVPFRVKEQGHSEYEILEQHADIKTASIREKQLQKKYGYPVDTGTYATSLENRYKGTLKQMKSGHTKKWNQIGIEVQQRKVNQILNGEVIGTFNSIKEACIHNAVNPLFGTKITAVCRGRRKRYLGYVWQYADNK
jgi:hypothetical protein